MTKKEYIDQLNSTNIDQNKVNKLEALFGLKLPERVKKMMSVNDSAEFFDDGTRMLSYQEVVDAEQDLHVDFKALGIIPVAECGENDFIVFNAKDNIWSKFNIVDEIEFKKKKAFEELLK